MLDSKKFGSVTELPDTALPQNSEQIAQNSSQIHPEGSALRKIRHPAQAGEANVSLHDDEDSELGGEG